MLTHAGIESLATVAGPQTAVRLSIHVLAAAIFVGGQFTVAGILPTLRTLGGDATKAVARAFGRLQWPAYFLLIVTGIWNAIASHPSDQSHAWNIVFGCKVAVVAIAGLAAYFHQRSRSKAGLAAFGGLAGMASLASLVLGVVLAG